MLGWATGHLPEPKNNPQIGMANMRGVMPALQKAPKTQVGSGAKYESVAVPKATRETRIVKDMSPDEIAKELAAWIEQD